MKQGPSRPGSFERFAVAALDHFAAALGYRALAEPRSPSGGWRRAYARDGEPDVLAVVGADDAGWVSLGVEMPVPRRRIETLLPALVVRLAPYEVAIDPDAGADPASPDAILRLALRLFPEGMTPAVFRDAAGNVIEAASEARRRLGMDPGATGG
jgi:hypothetical protein